MGYQKRRTQHEAPRPNDHHFSSGHIRLEPLQHANVQSRVQRHSRRYHCQSLEARTVFVLCSFSTTTGDDAPDLGLVDFWPQVEE
jgi:hypothetical protein